MSTLSEQREALEECIDASYGTVPPAKLELAKQGCLSMAWIERHAELVRALYKLQKDAPEMAKIFEAFPGAEISEVRRV